MFFHLVATLNSAAVNRGVRHRSVSPLSHCLEAISCAGDLQREREGWFECSVSSLNLMPENSHFREMSDFLSFRKKQF